MFISKEEQKQWMEAAREKLKEAEENSKYADEWTQKDDEDAIALALLSISQSITVIGSLLARLVYDFESEYGRSGGLK